jgi:ribosome maturation factor RimP
MAAWQNVVEQTIQETGLELVHAEWTGSGGSRLLRVYVDQPGGVGLDECERASHALSAALDADGEIGDAYTLEVSSPGLDRPLVKPADFERFAGERARIETRTPIGGSRRFVGVLRTAGGEGARLETAPGIEVAIAWENVSKARLAPLWPAPAPKPGHGPRRRK